MSWNFNLIGHDSQEAKLECKFEWQEVEFTNYNSNKFKRYMILENKRFFHPSS